VKEYECRLEQIGTDWDKVEGREKKWLPHSSSCSQSKILARGLQKQASGRKSNAIAYRPLLLSLEESKLVTVHFQHSAVHYPARTHLHALHVFSPHAIAIRVGASTRVLSGAQQCTGNQHNINNTKLNLLLLALPSIWDPAQVHINTELISTAITAWWIVPFVPWAGLATIQLLLT
jgi:hypothetical protein